MEQAQKVRVEQASLPPNKLFKGFNSTEATLISFKIEEAYLIIKVYFDFFSWKI